MKCKECRAEGDQHKMDCSHNYSNQTYEQITGLPPRSQRGQQPKLAQEGWRSDGQIGVRGAKI